MPLIQLQSHRDRHVLYQGEFPSLVAALEQAVRDRADLSGIDLRHANLSNANLDDAIMRGALLSGANLSGANLSEATLRGANFTGAALYNTCLCYADLTGCYFDAASFGATDIAGATLTAARFSTLSCFTLDFVLARDMRGCVFKTQDGAICTMSRPPVVIHGLARPVVFMDRHIRIGHDTRESAAFPDLLSARCLVESLAAEG